MLEILTEQEKEIATMLMQGQNYRVICEWIGINYKEYLQIKRSIFKKLNIKRVTQILPAAVQEKLIDSL